VHGELRVGVKGWFGRLDLILAALGACAQLYDANWKKNQWFSDVDIE
jgi:hypothetical protein